ncbi:MAG: Vacuolar protease A [Geoglossum umbratile]|nr:MAG: Vacuolar protease A [Geoglossum umbratile]
MRAAGWAIVLVFAAGAWAGEIRLPLRASKAELSVDRLSRLRRAGAVQKPLGLSPDSRGGGAKIARGILPLHTTNVSIGTPPQPFSLAVDMVEGNIFVPSSTCDFRCEEGYQRYNSSLSSTYQPDGSYMNVKWGEVSYTGIVSQDAFHISDLDVPELRFEEWTDASCYSVGCTIGGFDGVLGLGPPWSKWEYPNVPNTLSLLLSNNLLPEPLFSIKIPRTPDDEGELLLGGTNPALYTPPLVTLPIKNLTGEARSWFPDAWTVAASHVSFDTAIPIHWPLSENHVALIDSAIPWLILPSALSRVLTAAIGAERGPYWFSNIPCSRRGELPSLTFSLGPDGRNFSISAFDYTHQIDLPGAGLTCITTFGPANDFYGEDVDLMLLGSPFLKGIYGVFDMGKQEVGCEFLIQPLVVVFAGLDGRQALIRCLPSL